MPSTQPGAIHLTVPVPLQAKQIFSPAFGPSGGLSGALVTTGATADSVAELAAGLPQPASSQTQKMQNSESEIGLCMIFQLVDYSLRTIAFEFG
jgi:hypothetical protein